MENEKIIQAITGIFTGADTHNWTTVQQAMAANVLLDYTSMAGGYPATLTPMQITDAWLAFLPGFDKTHHHLSGFGVTQSGSMATAHCDGKADHFIDGEVWMVEGSYDAELTMENHKWVVTKLRFNLSGQSGNTNLPALAAQRAGNKK